MTDLPTRNFGIKQLLAAGIILLSGSLLWMNLYLNDRLEQMNRMQYAATAALLGTVREQAPELDVSDWVSMLNRTDTIGQGQYLLSRYGVLEGQTLMPVLSVRQRNLRICMNLFGLLVCGGMAALLLLYLYGRQKQISRLVSYLRSVEQGNYALDLGTNTEDELSGLKNELYKVTVMLREQAEQSRSQKKALADSVSDLSHQLKTPLASVTILLDNLSDSPSMDQKTRQQFLSEITRQLSQISWLTTTMLKLSRLSAGVVTFQRQPVEADRLLEEAAGQLSILAEWKQVSFTRKTAPGAMVYGDRHWLVEALANLIKNAIEHSPAGACVELGTEDNEVYTQFFVRDFGEGMTEEEQRQIFRRFYRSPYAGSDSTGIGLSLAKKIIDRQNGDLTLSSRKGEGTIFYIRFLKY